MQRACCLATMLAGLLLSAQPGPAQSVRTIALTRPDAEYTVGFTQVSSVRVLSDGRVLVVDGQERSVQLLNAALASATRVGRNGAGPGEYALPRRLYALRGDTSLLYDPGNSRHLLILPDGTAGETMPATNALTSVVAERGVDRELRFYYQVNKPAAFAAGSDLEWLVRVARGTARADTLARLLVPAGREDGSMTMGPGLIRRLTNRPLAAEDVVAVASDGWTAIIRTQPYRVEWIPSSGAPVSGPAIPHTPIRVDAAERRAFLEAQVVPGQIIVSPSGGRALPMAPPARGRSRDGERPPPPGFDEASLKWPAHKPPFLSGAAQIAGDGRVWVLRTAALTDSIPHYDVFDRAGQRVLRVDLPARTRLIGFGPGLVFLVRRDADDLQYVQRYRFSN